MALELAIIISVGLMSSSAAPCEVASMPMVVDPISLVKASRIWSKSSYWQPSLDHFCFPSKSKMDLIINLPMQMVALFWSLRTMAIFQLSWSLSSRTSILETKCGLLSLSMSPLVTSFWMLFWCLLVDNMVAQMAMRSNGNTLPVTLKLVWQMASKMSMPMSSWMLKSLP